MTLLAHFFSSVLFMFALLLALPVFSDLLSLFKILFRRSTPEGKFPDRSLPNGPRLLFLIPAHDEENFVGNAVHSIRHMQYPTNLISIYVVADNCSDGTAQVGRAAGALCLVREDPSRLGKQHAIAWALERIPFVQYDAIVIVDADSVVAPDFASGLGEKAPLRDKAVQSYNGVSNPTETALTRLAALLSAVYYEFMYPLRERAGLNVPLTGAGMCVGSGLLERYGWTPQAISENVEVYLTLSLAGERIECASTARIFSQEARRLKQGWTQRLRWRGGRLAVFRSMLRPMLRSRAVGLHAKLDMASELLLPGPATQLGLCTAGLGALLLTTPPGWPTIGALFGISIGRWAMYSASAILRVPNPLYTLISMAYLPVYMIWRLAAELRALAWRGRDERWIRTQRHTPK